MKVYTFDIRKYILLGSESILYQLDKVDTKNVF